MLKNWYQKIHNKLSGVHRPVHPLDEKFKRAAYPQEGEDLVLLKLFQWKRNGFYVDIGAHHPLRYSNTAVLHDSFGWSGANIDPLPGTKELFDEYRPSDINIQAGVSNQEEQLTFYHFSPEAYYTFDAEKAKKLLNNGIELVNKQTIQVCTPDHIFEKYKIYDREVDLLNLDVEGLELGILQSFDWSRINPHVICVEILGKSLDELASNQIYAYLSELNYVLKAKTLNTCIFDRAK